MVAINKEYAKRRRQLMSDMGDNSIAIIPSANEVIRNSDVHYAFRQDSDFFYLTGFDEPESVAVFIPGREHGEFVIFCRERDKTRELWDGFREGPEGACANYHADDAFPISDIDDILPGLIEGRDRVYYSLGRHKEFDAQVMNWINTIRAGVRTGSHPPEEFVDLNHLLHDLRLYKSADEIKTLQASADISARAHMRAMKACKAGVFEYQLEAEILHEFAMAGARQAAYSSIVGGGANACILHYVENREVLKDGDLVLIDAGSDYQYYAADITRTFPVNGKFSAEQAALYQLVLDAQTAAIDVTLAGNHWNQAHDATVQVITQGLVTLGLLHGNVDELIDAQAYKAFYMHRAGHWLGMDVHDVGDYKVNNEWRVLETGMVLTVEPGIYVAVDNMDVDEKWRGIGIRIEDDVVVTKTGNHVLTHNVVKEIADIEALMAQV